MSERYMEPEIIKRMVGECSSSVTHSTKTGKDQLNSVH